MVDLEKRVEQLEKRVKELERQLHSHTHLPNLPTVIRGIPMKEGQVIIPVVEG